MEHRNEALVVGYLGYRAEIFPNRCTNCGRKGRDAEPFPSPPPHFATFPLGLSFEGMGEHDANALGGIDNLFGSERPAGRAERRPRQAKKHL